MTVLEAITPNWRLMASPYNYAIVFLMVALAMLMVAAISQLLISKGL